MSPSQRPPSSGGLASASASASEKNANSSASPSAPNTAWPKKPRSCVVCRSRKVRCDKLSPCSNCRRANVACVVPSNDRPPRWARRLERITHNAAAPAAPPSQETSPGTDQVMERLRNLEGLVRELSVQLEQATAASSPAAHGANERETAQQPSTTSTAGVQQHFGRLVLQDSNQSRYISTGFWSRVSDELDGLKMDTQELASGEYDTSDDEDSPGKTPSTQELGRTPSERHAFLFGHNLGNSPDLREFRPLPSQIPFLLNIFSENVNFFSQIAHMPTVTNMIRGTGGTHTAGLTPANEALMFSIYYAAVTSMEDDDVVTNFGSTKAELNLKYRMGFEYALAKADFLNAPNLVLVQAFAIFLCLARRHDSPRFVWMMTGLVIRMAQAIGLHRDGSHFKNLSPFEVEMRRRVWWSLCNIDARASEDQGTDFTIAIGSFDTKIPLNINDADIDPETKETPAEREGLTDMSLARVWIEMCRVTKQMMAPGAKDGGPTLEEQSRLLNSVYDKLNQGYFQYATESGNIVYWVGTIITRLVISKMTLLIYLPTLFSSPNERFSDEVRTRLLVSAIEVAEYNHALNAEQKCRQWRWIYQTYTHWYAIVYLLIEASRRQWSPIVERAWIALHSSWLIPAQLNMEKKLQFWIPLRKLMAKARKHRGAELERLRGDASAIEELEMDDRNMPIPGSSGPFPEGKSEELFREHWRGLLVGRTDVGSPSTDTSLPSIVVGDGDRPQQELSSGHSYGKHDTWSNANFEPAYRLGDSQAGLQDPSNAFVNSNPTVAMELGDGLAPRQPGEPSHNMPFNVPADWSSGQSMGPGLTPWLWADADPGLDVFAGVDVNMDVDSDIDWNTWLESATGMDLNARPGETGF